MLEMQGTKTTSFEHVNSLKAKNMKANFTSGKRRKDETLLNILKKMSLSSIRNLSNLQSGFNLPLKEERIRSFTNMPP